MENFGIDFERELNSDQLAAVCAPYNRPALVLAGAGSGKTRTLTYRVAWFLCECSFSPKEVLLLTFTNKAAREMLERICSLTGFAASDFWGGTFHSLGNRFLRIEGDKIGLQPDFSILDADDADSFLKRCVEDEYPNFFSNKDNPRVKLLREIISYARNTCRSVPEAMMERFSWLETPAEQISDIANYYDFQKRRGNYCDFDDLLVLWKKLLQESDSVRRKYSDRFANILVDEYQDTNLLQSGILDLLADRGNITAVGDDAQCIYSWRGAEIENILRFKDRYPAAGIYKIERNYRSTPQILNFANAVLSEMPSSDEYRKSLVPARAGNSKPLVIRAMDASSQGRQVADCVRDIVNSGRYDYSDIAILYRSHFQAMDLQLQMQYKNLPFVMTSGVNFFEQAHIKDAVAMIRFTANPEDFVSLYRLMKFLPKVGEKTAKKIVESMRERAGKLGVPPADAMGDSAVLKKVPSAAKESYGALAEDIRQLRAMLKKLSDNGAKKGESSLKQGELFDASGAAQNFQVAPEGNSAARGGGNLAGSGGSHLDDGGPLPKDFVKAACSGWYACVMKTQYADWQERVDDFDALYEYASRYCGIVEFLDNVAIDSDSVESSGESGVSKVRLMTVHQAKGLEFPVVFIIGAAEGLFPTKRSIEDGDVEEERRLFYVAATRAMDHLVISYPRAGVVGGNFEMRSASRFLEAVDPSLYELAY